MGGCADLPDAGWLRHAERWKHPRQERQEFLLKSLLDACIGAFAWYLLGYGFAYDADDHPNPFIGVGPSHFALSGHKDWDGAENKGYDWIMWYF